MRKNKEPKIVKKAYNQGIKNLRPDELVLYFIYRTENFFPKNTVISRYELDHLLCETGKGTIRFDPELIDHIEKTNSLQKTKNINFRSLNKHTYFCIPHIEKEILASIIRVKARLINSIKNDLSNPLLRGNALEVMKSTIQSSAEIRETKILENSVQVTVIIDDLKFSIRYITNDQWVFPYSSEIWSLYKDSSEKDYFPILVAPRIHGICYSLFKTIGMLGFNPFAMYVYRRTLEKIKKVSMPITVPIDFRPGTFVAIEDDLKRGNDKLRYFVDNILVNIVNSKKHDQFTRSRRKLQDKLSEHDYEILDLTTLLKVIDFFPQHRLTEFIEKWCMKRNQMIVDLKKLS